jgi:hypothetical protein
MDAWGHKKVKIRAQSTLTDDDNTDVCKQTRIKNYCVHTDWHSLLNKEHWREKHNESFGEKNLEHIHKVIR